MASMTKPLTGGYGRRDGAPCTAASTPRSAECPDEMPNCGRPCSVRVPERHLAITALRNWPGWPTGRAASSHITVPHDRHPEPIRGALVHRSDRIAQATHPAQLPPRTRVEETVIDLTQISASRDDACAWLSGAVERRLTTAMRLQSALDGRPKVRWRAELGGILADIAAGVHSLLEHRYIRDVERAHGLPTATRQVKTVLGSRSRYVDNLYAKARLVVELDGQIAHAAHTRWDDVHRDNAHATIGILTLRYNWSDVTLRPCSVAQEIARVLERRRVRVRLRRCGPGCTIATPATRTS
jgi:hypothetical protein